MEKTETDFIKKIINPFNIINYKLNNSFPFRLSHTEITQEVYGLAHAINSFCEHSYNFQNRNNVCRKKYLENVHLESIDNRLIHNLVSGKNTLTFRRESKDKTLYIAAAFIYNETFNTCKFFKNIIRIKLDDFEPYDFIKTAGDAVSFWEDKFNFNASIIDLKSKTVNETNDHPVIYYNPEQSIEIDSKLIEIYRITNNSAIEIFHPENIVLHLKPSSVKGNSV